MSFEAAISITDVIDRIRSHRLLLPAIQREFVWGPDKVEWLFDSLLQGFPFGSFLFWEVRDGAKTDYRYYEFLRTYRERYQTHNPEFNTGGHADFYAVLDGQQRLTSLYLGLTGTYAYKRPRVWWDDTEDALPTRRLYLNIVGPAAEDDETHKYYDFRFLTAAEFEAEVERWFLVADILKLANTGDLLREFKAAKYKDNEFAADALGKLHQAVHMDRVINFYNVKKADLDRALDVFVRVNTGSEPLSLSDMLMSTAIANWQTRDAKKEILGLVDAIQDKGFFVNKDLVLKACLYLYCSDISYRARNFSAQQVGLFERNWDAIELSIRTVFDLVREFGYNETSLTSKNALLPIIYYVHHRGIARDIRQRIAYREEIASIRRWLHLMLLKGVFGTSADTILTALRKAFTAEFSERYMNETVTCYPTAEITTILQAAGKDPIISDEFIDSLLFTQYSERQAFTILALLAPNLDYKNGDFHKDHLHPDSWFGKRRLKALGVPDADIEFFEDSKHRNSILNLRHLDGMENKSKQDKALVKWVKDEAARQNVTTSKFCVDRDLPDDLQKLEFLRFREFISERRQLLSARLKELLGHSAPQGIG